MQELSHPIRLADLAFLVDSTKHSSALIPRSTRGRCNNQAAVCTHQGLQKKKKKKKDLTFLRNLSRNESSAFLDFFSVSREVKDEF